MDDSITSPPNEGRAERKKRRLRQALIEAGGRVMSEKGVDAATMSEIAEAADVGVGTAYNYFASKEELAIAAMEQVMGGYVEKIEPVVLKIDDPGQRFAIGLRTLLIAIVTDPSWKPLLRRSEIMSGAVYRVFVPYAGRDFRLALESGRFRAETADLAWRLCAHVIVGFGLEVAAGEIAGEKIDEVVVDLLGMCGVDRPDAWELVRRPHDEISGNIDGGPVKGQRASTGD